MKRELQLTADGSHTIAIPDRNITYHSVHGAIQESQHVFIEAGLAYLLSQSSFNDKKCIRVFEMGFGTGLNALLSFIEIRDASRCMYYQAAELYPLQPEEAAQLNYPSQLDDESLAPLFTLLHQSSWNEAINLSSFFTLCKSNISLLQTEEKESFHLIYFDAFAPDVQPELWQTTVFEKMYRMLVDGGLLVTYCSKGSVRRTMQSAGFRVEKIPGPPGKREIIRAIKKS